jgi:hypothetical protein
LAAGQFFPNSPAAFLRAVIDATLKGGKLLTRVGKNFPAPPTRNCSPCSYNEELLMKTTFTTILSTLVAALLFSLPNAAALNQIVYYNDFDGGLLTAAGVTVAQNGGVSVPTIAPYDATFGNISRADDNTTGIELILNNLPAHTGVNLDFALAFLDSWDSTDGGNFAPDLLELYIDGAPFAAYTYNNALGTIKDFDGGTLLHEYVQFNTDLFYSDTVVDMATDPTLIFPHTASTLSVKWIASGAGWQGGSDEAYAIDNVWVELEGVQIPEPTTWMLAALGAAGFALRRKVS